MSLPEPALQVRMIPCLLLALLALQETAPEPVHQVEGFRYEPDQLHVGRVYHYRKSNVDGTNASFVDLYVASNERIESFKYHRGHPEATLVTADMDWRTFSVKRFETSRLYGDGTRRPVAELVAKGDKLYGKAFGNTFEVHVERFPWHTYDFDLASLNVSLRYLADPEDVVLLGMIDPVGNRLAFKGEVELRYLADELRNDIPCRRYSLDGPGLEERGGDLWVRSGDDPVIVDYEIDLPDEPGMVSGKLLLLKTAEMTPAEWQEHRLQCLR